MIKFKDYKSLLNYFIEAPAGNNISKFHELLLKSNLGFDFSRAFFFENILYPALKEGGLSHKQLISFIYIAIKEDGFLSKWPSLEEWYEDALSDKKLENFLKFLQTSGYISKPDNNQFRNLLSEHISHLKSSFLLWQKTNIIESIELFRKSHPSFIWNTAYWNQVNALTAHFHNIIKDEIKTQIENLDLLLSLEQKIIALDKVLPNNHNLVLCNKLIKERIELIQHKIEEENQIKSSFKRVNDLASSLSAEMISSDLATTITSQNGKYAYANFVSIGKFIYEKQSFPILFDFLTKGGFYMEASKGRDAALNIIQNIVLRIYFSFPRGHIKIKIIDKNYGSSFQHLLNLPVETIGSQVYYDDSMVLKLFDEAKKRDAHITFNKLKSSYNNLIEYNKVNEVDFEPIEIFLISDFPDNFNSSFVQYITEQIKNGSKTGRYFFICTRPQIELQGKDGQIYKALFKILPLIQSDISQLSYYQKSELLDQIKYKLYDSILLSDNLIKQYFIQTNESPLSSERPSPDVKVPMSIEEEIKIPIGMRGNQIQQFLNLGNNSGAYHGLVCGTTGSGKSVLLHQIIVEGSRIYTPDDLQFILLDYKEGTGFKVYKELPHARIIAIDADIDFGLETLKFLVGEMKSRAILFKKHDTKDIKGFRIKSGKKCPRLLIIIDEFQVLLDSRGDESDKSREAQKLLEDIVRLGRSFGIHLLLATQTPSGVKWTSGTIENISVRIGLRMSTDAENYLFKHSKPIASQFVERFGKAVYNDKSGTESESVIFNVTNLDEEKIPLYVQEAVIDSKKANTYPVDRTVHEGGKFVNMTFPSSEKISWSDKNDNLKIYLGLESKINPKDVYLVGNEPCIPPTIVTGINEVVKKDTLKQIFLDFIRKSVKTSKLILYCEDELVDNVLGSLLSHFDDAVITNNRDELINQLRQLHIRYKENDFGNNRLLFIIYGMKNLGKIGGVELNSAREFSSSKNTISTLLNDILSMFSNLNISFMCFTDDKLEVEAKLGIRLSSFDLGISLGNYNNRIKSGLSDSLMLKDNEGVLYRRRDNSETKFRVISFAGTDVPH